MDKKSIIGLVLCGVILFGYSWWNGKRVEKAQAAYAEEQYAKFKADSIDRAEHPYKYLQSVVDNIQDEREREAAAAALAAKQQQQFQTNIERNFGGTLVAAMNGQEQLYTFENDVMAVTVSSLGGKVTDVTLKDYKRYSKKGDGAPIQLFDPKSVKFDLSFYLRKGYSEAKVSTADYYFDAQPIETLEIDGVEAKRLSMRLPIDTNAYVEFIYTMRPGDYMIDYDVRFVGMEEWMQTTSSFDIDWENTSYQNEKGFQNENQYTTISYLYPEERKLEKLGVGDSKRGRGHKEQTITTTFEWFDFQQQFFSSIMIAPSGFSSGVLAYDTYAPGSGYVKDFKAAVAVPFKSDQSEYNFKFYFGPNKFSILKNYEIGLEKVVQLGGWLVRWCNRWVVIPVFDFLSKYISSFGIIILLLTLFIKLVIFPFTYKSYMSSAKMRALKPEIDAINAKYPNQQDQQEMLKRQQSTMDLYKKCGVSPLGGCLPMLLQMPIVIAMFRFFPTSIELRGQRFLWAEDLSTYDSVLNLPFNIPWYGDHVSLFALIMAVTLFFYSKLTYEQQNTGGQQMAGMKFMTVYLMPIMMLLWMNNYASGLCYYYFVSQLITMGQTWAFRAAVNDDKIHAQLMSASKKNDGKKKPKSKWQQRLEDMQKEQRRMMEERDRKQYRSKH
ncbi:MAG: membrane protein insertase YidC [Tidjanibacter sp.]|nr:membrane protein insertase YidC [Tidjanibacter sp.]